MKNMKFLKRTVAIVLAGIMSLSVVACGGDQAKKDQQAKSNGGKEVKIAFWHAGMGLEYLENMVNEFNSKQSDWFVTYEYSAIKDSLTSALGLEDTDETDLYMIDRCYDTQYMEPLDDLLQSTADGDQKPLIEKFNKSYLEMEIASDGHYYTLTNGGGVIGIVYNKKLFDKAGIDVLPRTTDELAVACDMLLEAKVTPIANFGTGGYWDFYIDAWQAQYDSFDYYVNNFHGCTDLNGNSPSKDVFTTKDGRYQVLKALEKIVTPEYVVAGASSETHTSMQTKFLNSDIGMMVNGSWLSNESGEAGDMNNYGVMRTPVISTITDKLTSVRGDKELRALVSAIDTVIDGEKTATDYQSGDGYEIDGRIVNATDWDYVMAARTTTSVNYVGQSNFIPNYSDAKEGAKEFLKFFYSDEGIKMYADATHINLPLSLSNGEKIDTSDWNISDERPAGDSLAHRWAQEWIKAKEQYHRLDNIIPYNVCRGNHDDLERIAEYFPVSDYEGLIDGYYEGMHNNYLTFSVGTKNYLLVTIDYGADAQECAWADGIIKAHPNHNAIVVTHAYIDQTGYIDSSDPYPNSIYQVGALNGDEIWENVINENPNVTMVICGHVNGDFITYERTGANGNIVQEVMVNPQNIDAATTQGTGLVGMLLFSEREDGNLDMQFEYYSTVRRQWYDSRYQLVGTGDDGQALTVNVVEDDTTPKITGIEHNGIYYCGAVEVTVTDDDGLSSVTLNGTEVTLVDGKFTVGVLEGIQTIVATDTKNNTTTYQITVNDHVYGDWIGGTGGSHTRVCEKCGIVDSNSYVWDTTMCVAESLEYTAEYKTTPPVCQTEGYLFAGWYNTYADGVFGKTVTSPSVGTNYYAKFVPADVLTVKCQVTEDTTAEGALGETGRTGKTNVRFVTTVDSLNYSAIGFDIIETTSTSGTKVWEWSTDEVCEKITADAGAGVYSYSPCLFDAASMYYATVTMTNVTAEEFDNAFLIKPYWVTSDGTKVYGVSRYMRVSDSYNGIVNIPVYLNDDTTISSGTTITVTSKMGLGDSLTNDNQLTYQGYDAGTLISDNKLTVQDSGNVITITVNETEEIDATGLLVNLKYKPKYSWSAMQSRFVFQTTGTVTVLDSEYRNVFGNGTEDRSSFNGNSDKTIVVASPAELRGLATWSNSQSPFGGKIVKLAADIDLNPGWDASSAAPSTIWAPIGSGTFSYQGIFDGQGHTIKGIYVNNTSLANVGLFGKLQGTVKNVRLQNSYITGGTNTGSIVGSLASGTLDTVYSDATVYKVGETVGGLVGKISYCASNVIRNCWYAGEVSGTSNTGGFVGNCDGSGLTIEHCYNTGRVNTVGNAVQVGGFIGFVNTQADDTVLIKDSLSFAGKAGNYVSSAGAVIGTTSAGAGVITISNTYGTTNFIDWETSGNYPSTNWYGHLIASAGQKVTVDNVEKSTGAIDVNMLHEMQIRGYWAIDFNLSFDNGESSEAWWMKTETNGLPILKSFSDMPFKALRY